MLVDCEKMSILHKGVALSLFSLHPGTPMPTILPPRMWRPSRASPHEATTQILPAQQMRRLLPDQPWLEHSLLAFFSLAPSVSLSASSLPFPLPLQPLFSPISSSIRSGPSVRSFVRLSVHPSVRRCVLLSVFLPLSLSLSFSFFSPSLALSLSLSLSLYLSLSLSRPCLLSLSSPLPKRLALALALSLSLSFSFSISL